MKKIIKKSLVQPLTGVIADTINIDDKITNTYSARVISNIINSMNVGDFTPIGSGMDYYGTTAPANYMFADGSAISRTEYAELFAVIGTTYGAGDGSTTFNLPDKRSRVSVMTDDGTFAILGGKGGAETVTLTTAQMPSHTHIQNAHCHQDLMWGNGSNKYFGVNDYGTNTPSATQGTWKFTYTSTASEANFYTNYVTATNQNAGGGEAHNNLQPFLVCNYIIKVKSGISPSTNIVNLLEEEY